MKAMLKNYRQSPRKVRLVADFVRGKRVDNALAALSFLPKKAAGPVKKLIESAVANAKETQSLDKKDLMIKKIQVDQGFVFQRYRARARGRAALIRKKTSRVSIELDKAQEKRSKKKPQKQN